MGFKAEIKLDSFLKVTNVSNERSEISQETAISKTVDVKSEQKNSGLNSRIELVESGSASYSLISDSVNETFESVSDSEKEIEKVSKIENSTGLEPVELSKDPALWEINDSTREILSRHGFSQNISSDFSNSERLYSDQRRFLTKNVFQRKLKNNEEVNRSWLIYSESKGSVFCGPCLVFEIGESQSQFSSKGGFNDWKNVEKRVVAHENTLQHKSCILAMKCRSESDSNIDSLLFSQVNEEISYWRNVLKRVVAVVKALSSRGLAFRGTSEVFGDMHNGNYMMFLEVIAEFDPFLAKHIESHGNQGSGSTSYLSKTVCDEFIFLMSKKAFEYISEELKSSKYFSLILDSTTDIGHVDQLTLVIRYVLNNGEACERFIKFLPSVGHKAQDLFLAVTSELKALDINIEDCRGQSYDNASNMSGLYNGLQAKIKEISPFAFYAPCAGHSANLSGSAAAESTAEGFSLFMLLEEVYVFFVRSTERWKKLTTEIENKNTLKRVNLTRWSGRESACKSLKDSWFEVQRVLKSIEDDPAEKPITRNEAKGIRIKLERLETAFMVEFWNVILERLNKVMIQIQSSTIDLQTVTELYKSLHDFVIAERENFKYFEEKAMEISVVKKYETETCKRKRKRKTFADEVPEEELRVTASDRFRIETYLVIIDRLSAELKKRHAAYLIFSNNFSFLIEMNTLSVVELTEKASSLIKAYPDDLEENLISECIHFASYISSMKDTERKTLISLSSLLKFLRNRSLQNIYPNLDIALRIAVCIPATNCSGERSFSCLKRVKNYHRSSLSQEKLNSLALLSIESNLIKSIDYDELIDDFANKKSRKQLM
ncbi:zinc finger MYM-type protein 1-like [Leptopilina boulardi]|uniref:zinc finger MYM-type protein 1-like n=1 Tax=Leptopilina boulardi TaxID=63433 RepID=UPI0021F66024|nr:zinc finger MYM-type protein 1-like [Leptopilina boulardi]